MDSPVLQLNRLSDLQALFNKSQQLLDRVHDQEDQPKKREMWELPPTMQSHVNPLGEQVALDMI